MKGLSSCFACEIKGCLISAGSFIIQLFAGMVAAPKVPYFSSPILFLPALICGLGMFLGIGNLHRL